MRKKLTDRMAVLGQGKLRHLLWKDRVSFRKFCLCGYAWPCDKYSPTSLSVAYWQSSFGSAYLENRAPAKLESLQLSESLALSEGVSSLHKQTFHQSIWYQTLESLGEMTGDVKIHLLPSASVYLFEVMGMSGVLWRVFIRPSESYSARQMDSVRPLPIPSKWTWHTQLWDKSTKRWKMKSPSLPVFSMFILGFSGKSEDCFTLFMTSSCAGL